jgi:hypothetical protein
MRQLSTASNALNAQFPALLTYIGGATDRLNGAYAGIADWQGLDSYIAACAPTQVGATRVSAVGIGF